MKKFLCFTVILLIAGSLFAQTPRELRLGTSYTGYLQPGEEHWFTVRSSEFGFISVETTGSLDTKLEVYNSSYELLATDDDGGEDTNAKLEIMTAVGDIFHYNLYAYSEEDSGQYRIWASTRPIPPAYELRIGSSVPGNMLAGDDIWYKVSAFETGYMVVETSGNLDTMLEAYTSNYVSFASNDDGGDNYNARLEIDVEAGAVYYFRLKCYDNEDTGPFRIWASFESIPPETDFNYDMHNPVTLRLGEAFPVFLRSEGESRWYRYDITRPGTHFVIQTRGSMDTKMYLYDSYSNIVAEDDDSGDDYNARISQRLAVGSYLIEVYSYSGNTGRFTLHAETR